MKELISQFVTAASTSSATATGTGSNEIAVRLIFGVVMGLCISIAYIFCNKRDYSRNFAISLIILPAIVAAVIWLIGNDLTKAISLGGIFALIKFRSVPGDSKDISNVFVTMAVGLAIGLGYYLAAVLIAVAAVAVLMIFSLSPYAKKKEDERQLKITVPENLNFEGVFDEILKKYTSSYTLDNIKTTHMGTLMELTYTLVCENSLKTKEFIDELRTRNGNLEVSLSRRPSDKLTTIL